MLTAAVFLLSACGQGRHARLTVQFCVGHDGGVVALKQMLQEVAAEFHMEYTDASVETIRDLQAIGATGEHMHATGGAVHVALDREDGLGVMGGNLGLNRYDMAFGFSHDPNERAAMEFSDHLLAKLRQHWTYKVVPAGTGAFPDPSCVAPETPAPAPPNSALQRSGEA